MHLAPNCIGCIGCITPREKGDSVQPHKVGLTHPLLGLLHRFRGPENACSWKDLIRFYIGCIGLHCIGARLPMQQGYNCIGSFVCGLVGNLRDDRYD
jgi:hypothetical protein